MAIAFTFRHAPNPNSGSEFGPNGSGFG
ncbi:unnamed protein product, partial [Rotaria sp. Silwood1]